MRGKTNSIKLNHGLGAIYPHCPTTNPLTMESKAEHVGFGATTVVALLATGRQLSIVLLYALECGGEYGRETGLAYISEKIVAVIGLIVEVSKVLSMVLKICCREYSGAERRYRRS